MLGLLLVMLCLCLLGLGAGWLVGRGGRYLPQPIPIGWVLPLGVTLAALAVPAAFLLDRVGEVAGDVNLIPGSVQALALRFAALTLGLLAAALCLTFLALWKRPFLAPSVPAILFVVFYGAALPLAYRVQQQHQALYLDNIPTIWLFVFCGVASAGLLGYALGTFRPPPAAAPSGAQTPRR